MRRIVVIRPGALGDTLLTFPALALLRRRWPAARLTFVARGDTLALAHASGLADETSPYDSPAWSALFADPPALDGLAATTLRESDLAVAWLSDPEGLVARNLTRLGARAVLVAPGRPAPNAREHVAPHVAPHVALHIALHIALQLARSLAPAGVPTPATLAALVATLPSLRAAAEDARRGEAVWRALRLPAGQALAIHPGSGGAAKRWPPASFARLIALARAAGYAPLLVEGPQDATVVTAVLGMGAGATPVARGLSPGALAALLPQCARYVGNDAGVTHLAALLGLPTLALFGPTDPALWAPLGPQAHALRAPDGALARLTPDEVLRAIDDLAQLAPTRTGP